MKTFLLIILTATCYGQQLVYNTDLKRGNGNQWIYVDASGREVKEIRNLIPLVVIDTTKSPVKNVFIPTPASASIAGFIMMDSIINGKKVSIIKEDMEVYDTLRSHSNTLIGVFSGRSITNKSNNIFVGVGAFRGASAGMFFPDEKPEPGEKLQLCRYCDMMRTLAHRIYIAKMMGAGYVQISKGVWAYTN